MSEGPKIVVEFDAKSDPRAVAMIADQIRAECEGRWLMYGPIEVRVVVEGE